MGGVNWNELLTSSYRIQTAVNVALTWLYVPRNACRYINNVFDFIVCIKSWELVCLMWRVLIVLKRYVAVCLHQVNLLEQKPVLNVFCSQLCSPAEEDVWGRSVKQYLRPAAQLFLDYNFTPCFWRYSPLQPGCVREAPCHLISLQADFMEPIRTQRWMWLGRSWWPWQRCRWVFNPFIDFIDDFTPRHIIASFGKPESTNSQRYLSRLIRGILSCFIVVIIVKQPLHSGENGNNELFERWQNEEGEGGRSAVSCQQTPARHNSCLCLGVTWSHLWEPFIAYGWHAEVGPNCLLYIWTDTIWRMTPFHSLCTEQSFRG